MIAKVKSTLLGQEHDHILNGRFHAGAKPRYRVFSPIDGRVLIGKFATGDAVTADVAVNAARSAFSKWRLVPWKERVAQMRRIADEVEKRRHELGMLILQEVGKSRLEAMGEAEEVLAFIRHYCDEMEKNDGYAHPLEQLSSSETTFNCLRPYGVFAVISPFNFPVGLATSMMTAALLGGNTVVLKPSPQNAATALFFGRLAHEAGLPSGTLNIVTGDGEVGRVLIEHDGIDGVAFTGSRRVGMQIHRKFAQGPFVRPVIAEMGGKNSAFVTRSADLDDAAAGVASAAFGLQGQKCTACSRVYVDRDVAVDFSAKLVECARAMRIGNPEDRDVYLGPIINGHAAERFKGAVADALKDGRVLCGGEILSGGEFDHGHYLEPTVVVDLPAGHRLLEEELFLPFVSIVQVDSLEQAIEISNASDYGLGSGIFTRTRSELAYYLQHIEAGVIYANRASSATTGAWPGAQSFCGWKASGHTGKGGMGPNYVQQFMREQSHTLGKVVWSG